jgi:hypothetical protein
MEQVEIANGNGNGTAAEHESAGPTSCKIAQSPLPAKSGFQRRVNQLIRQKKELEGDLARALELIGRYRAALRAARDANHG